MSALLVALALAAAPPPAARVVEEIVAVVRNPASAPPRVVTLTKLDEEARIALVSRGASAAATGPLDAEALRAALDWLLAQMLLADDAARLRVDEVPREDVVAELRRF
jgi:DNA-binding response OmpR family regulator